MHSLLLGGFYTLVNHVVLQVPGNDMRFGIIIMYFVFHTSCAALTLIRAVSSVKGGTGGLVVDAIVEIIEIKNRDAN